MDTFLLSWNPKRFFWTDLEANIRTLTQAGHLEGRWSCGNTRQIAKGSRFFLMRLGEEPKGIIAAGTIKSEPYAAEHWEDPEGEAWYVDLSFTVLRESPLIPLSTLRQSPFNSVSWTPMASGVRIPTHIAKALEKLVQKQLKAVEPGQPLGASAANLEPRHRKALQWFLERAGQQVTWPQPLADGTRLATLAKAIYKPAWSAYALSVRQTLGGTYPDREPTRQPDGSWTYMYFQETKDIERGRNEYTNKGLSACMRDRVPVGVMRQVSPKPNVRYEVLGLALVVAWKDGFFTLQGLSPGVGAQLVGDQGQRKADLAAAEKRAEEAGEFSPGTEDDARERVLASVVRRRGQPAFRDKLLGAYGRRCAITGCDAEPALEASHITPYRGPDTNSPANGLLLRADIHTLWDLGLIAVDEATGRVLIDPSLQGTSYADLEGRRVAKPGDSALAPSKAALRAHREGSEL